MTKILFAASKYGNPILATNDDAFKEDIGMAGCDLDDHVPSADVMNLLPGLWVWEGERRESWFHDELDIDLLKSEIRPATRQDLEEMGFACPAGPPGSLDSRRLDWLDEQIKREEIRFMYWQSEWPPHAGQMVYAVSPLSRYDWVEGPTLREAVDAAMNGPCPEDTVARGSFMADVARDLDQMQPGETLTIRCDCRS